MPQSIAAQVWLEFASACESVATKEDLSSLLLRTMRALGYDQVNVSLIRDYDLPAEELKFGWACTYPEDWLAYYADRSCVRFDPVAQSAHGDSAPFFWSDLKERMNLTPLQSNFLGLAEEAGLCRGVGLPFFGPKSLCGGIALATSYSKNECLRDLNVLWAIANLFYRTLRTLVLQTAVPLRSGVELTAREMQILSLSASGLSDRRIGFQLDISDNTVNSHLRKIYRKLGAHTRTHAFALAVRERIIDLP